MNDEKEIYEKILKLRKDYRSKRNISVTKWLQAKQGSKDIGDRIFHLTSSLCYKDIIRDLSKLIILIKTLKKFRED